MKNKIIKLKKSVIANNGNEYDELLVSHDLNNASLSVKVRSSHDHALCVVLSYDFRALKKERQENQFFCQRPRTIVNQAVVRPARKAGGSQMLGICIS